MATFPSMMAAARAGGRESGRIAMSIYAGRVLQQRNDWISVFSGYIRGRCAVRSTVLSEGRKSSVFQSAYIRDARMLDRALNARACA